MSNKKKSWNQLKSWKFSGLIVITAPLKQQFHTNPLHQTAHNLGCSYFPLHPPIYLTWQYDIYSKTSKPFYINPQLFPRTQSFYTSLPCSCIFMFSLGRYFHKGMIWNNNISGPFGYVFCVNPNIELSFLICKYLEDMPKASCLTAHNWQNEKVYFFHVPAIKFIG